MVEDVIEGSPAEKAKFKVGDEVFAVGSNFSHSITAYKNILQTPNEQIKVIVVRNGQLVQLFLNTKSIK
jgi:C-terminal processing protease CtpA/Prc